jgi:tRNA(fMet)-specific endonuclease VapC
MPANGDVLLDTSIIIPYFRGDASLQSRFQPDISAYLPLTVLGELYCGAHLSQHPAKKLAQISNFLRGVMVLAPGSITAEEYGRTRAALAKAGTPLPENDIWIAALALEYQLPLAARDAHFDSVNGLMVLKW